MAEIINPSPSDRHVHAVILQTTLILAAGGGERREIVAKELVSMGAALMAHAAGVATAADLLREVGERLARDGIPPLN